MEIADLFNAACEGDREAENELFKKLSVRFAYLADNRIWDSRDAEELVQSALMAVHRDFRKLNGHPSFEAWAYKVLNNRILSYFRDKERERDRLTFAVDEGRWAQVKDRQIDPELKSKLRRCLSRVRKENTNYARILALHFQGHTTDEICSKLNISPNNLYVTLSRARTALAKCLDEDSK